MGKIKIGIYCYFMADILMKVFLKILMSGPLFLSKPLNLIGCHGNQKSEFAKKYSKINSSEAIWGRKLKLCSIFITLASTKVLFFAAVAYAFWLLWQLRISIDGKHENWL